MNIKIIMGLGLGFSIGLGCALMSIPVPAPPVLIGALLVVAMTSGYILTDKYICPMRSKMQMQNCGGPSAELKDTKES